MPRPVSAFACIHGCHRNVLTNLKSMKEHELICFKNPIRKACQTCKNYVRSGGLVGEDQDYEGPYCEVRDDVDLSDKLHFDCPKWENKQP